VTDFAAVDAGDVAAQLAMMAATDAWPAVRRRAAGCSTRSTSRRARSTALDGAAVSCIDLDRSVHMPREVQRRHPDSRAVRADVAQLPLPDGVVHLTRAERVLQWTPHPVRVLDEVLRVTAPGGHVAVTDTDWATLAIEHPDPTSDPTSAARLSGAALGWVPHPRVAAGIGGLLRAAGLLDLVMRRDTVELNAWDPDDPRQHDGPPGLPLHSIADGMRVRDRSGLTRDLAVLAERARAREAPGRAHHRDRRGPHAARCASAPIGRAFGVIRTAVRLL
jgi:SAM-dependent methyltransferase